MAGLVLGAWVLLHMAMLLAPGAALAIVAPRLNPISAIVLGAGLAAEASFFLYFLRPGLGRAFTFAVLAASVVVLVRQRQQSRHLWSRSLVGPFGLLAGMAFVVTGSLTLYGDFAHPATTSNNRYIASLPVDNVMPFFLGDRVIHGDATDPFVAEWLSSDRPPLQSGAMSFAHPVQFGMNAEAHYQALSTVANLLWIAPLWLLLRRLRVPERLVVCAVAVVAFSGMSVFYGAYVWPKGLSAAFALLTIAEIVDRRVVLAGVAAGLGLLAHGGAFFALVPLIAFGVAGALLAGRRPIRGLVAAGLAAGVVLAPWLAYQRWHAPPGNRLLKWHLAGVIAIDDRSTTQAIWDAYRRRPLRQIADNKWSNAEMLVSKDRILGDVFPLMGGAESISRVRQREFGHLANGLGVALFGIPAAAWCAIRRKRSTVVDAAAVLTGFASFGLLAWVLLMFGPQTTFPHHGSAAIPFLLMAGLTLFVGALHERLAVALAALAAARVLRVWVLAEPLMPHPVRAAAVSLVVIGIGVAAATLIAGTRGRGGQPPGDLVEIAHHGRQSVR